MISCFMFLMPNLNSAAMVPVGDIAGTASAMTGAVRVALGALFGGIGSARVVDSVTPLLVGVVLLSICAAIAVALVRRSERRAALAERADMAVIEH
jgi:DHA1 family bicyclomycin/chloramphenicol resistance-like MFS transporter